MSRRRARAASEEHGLAPGRRALRRLLVAALLVSVGWLAALVWPGPLLPERDAAVPGVASASVRIERFAEAGGGVAVAPADGGADILLVLYGGGLVRPDAYTWLGVSLAPVGVRTLVPAFPLDLAVLARDRAGALLDDMRSGERRVVLAGHSLGGAEAAAWAESNAERLDGLVLMGAYPGRGTDLSGLTLPTLVLAAEHDGRARLETVREASARLPSQGGLELVGGAVHAFFGRYGPQWGDGTPTVSRGEAEREIAAALEAFVLSLR